MPSNPIQNSRNRFLLVIGVFVVHPADGGHTSSQEKETVNFLQWWGGRELPGNNRFNFNPPPGNCLLTGGTCQHSIHCNHCHVLVVRRSRFRDDLSEGGSPPYVHRDLLSTETSPHLRDMLIGYFNTQEVTMDGGSVCTQLWVVGMNLAPPHPPPHPLSREYHNSLHTVVAIVLPWTLLLQILSITVHYGLRFR